MNRTTSILVVDDDPAVLQVYSEMLRTEGYEVLEASTGQDGLRIVRQKRPDLVLLDVRLPDLSGVEVCRQIKADPALLDVFVMLFSGLADGTPDKLDGLAAGADDYVAKSVDPQELLARVRLLSRLQATTAALRASEQHYRQLLEILPEAVGSLDLQARLLAVNPHGVSMLGYANPSELLAKSAYDLTPPETHERVRTEMARTLTAGAPRRGEYTLLKKGGQQFPAELSAAISTDAHGQPVGFVLVARDISERQRAEAQIRLLADAMQSTTELVCITDAQNRFSFANQAFLEAYGYRLEEILGKTPQFLYSPKNPPGLCDQILQKTLEGGWKGELLDRTKDGREFPISLSTSPIRNDQGKVIGLVGVARDITVRQQAERQKAAFAHLGYRLSAANTREEAAQIIMDIASELFGWDAGYVHLYSASDDLLIPVLTVDTVEGQRTPVQPGSFTLDPSPLMRLVMKEGAQLINRGNKTLPGMHLVPFGDTARRSASMMYAPVHAGSTVVGVLSIQSYFPQAYSVEDLKLLQTLADHCGDTLQRIEIARTLRQAEAKYRGIVQNATEGIFQTTPEGRVRSANPALARMLGYETPEELVSGITDLEHQGYVNPERRREFRGMVETQGSVRGFEFEHYLKDGSLIWVSINAHVVRDASGAVLYYEGTIQDITKRKRAEEALEMSRIVQEALLDNIHDPAWLKDTQGRFLACNESLAKFHGLPRKQILGGTVFDTVSREAARLTAEDEEVMRSRRPLVVEAPLTDAEGRCRWFETIKSPLLNEAGEVTGTVGIARETTERKWGENVLKLQRDFGMFLSATRDLSAAAERLLKLALENDGIDCGAVYLVDPRTGAMDLVAQQGLSAAFTRQASHVVAGSTPAPLASPVSVARPRRRRGPLAEVVRLLGREGLLALETIPMQHGGTIVAALNVGSHAQREIPLRSCQAIEAVAAQAAGAIARIRAEQSLRTHQELLEKTLHGLRAAVLFVDAPTSAIQNCNPAAARIFGYSREEMIGQTPSLLHVNEEKRAEFRQHLEAAVKEKGFLADFEFTMRRKDGTTFPSKHHVLPVRNEAGEVATWVAVIRDITERKRTEEGLRLASRHIIEAQEAERLRVARELHDGVNQIIASAKMRLHKVGDMAAGLGPAGREILDRCDRLLVQALEENRRIAHDLRPPDLDALGLAAACRNFCKELQSRTSLQVKCQLTRRGESLPAALRLNLFRIVQEALTNVERHAQAKTVWLRIAFQGSFVVLKIRDDGCGFNPNESGPLPTRGRGIGLTNMRERAAALGGTCKVASAPGQGTTLTVRVPCGQPS